MKHIIVIDDTGSPGNFNETRFLKENRKTLVAVFIHSKNRKHFELTIKNIVSILNIQFGVTELHLKDLVNRTNEFAKISDEDALSIIMLLSQWFSSIQIPYFVQTCKDTTFFENNIPLKGKLDIFNFDKGEDQALFILIAKIKLFMAENFPDEEVEIVMDEGRKKNNQVEKTKFLDGFGMDNSIKYFSSKEFALLQVADFFAYSINRIQLTIIKENKTEFDKKIYKYVSTALTNQYSIGTYTIETELENFTKDDYDYLQYTQRQIDGNLDYWLKSQKK